VRSWPALGDLNQELVNVGAADIDHLAITPGGQDESVHHASVVGSGIRREARQVLFEVSLDQVPDRWSGPALISGGKRIDALVDLALDLLGLFARRNGGPIWKIADEEVPASAFERVVECEALAAGLANLDAKADHFVIHEDR
jgi:hypothetical protein